MTKYTDTGKKDTRSGFGAGLYEAGKADSRVVALTADLKGSLKMDAFANDFPERFIQCGIAESNMIGVAAGLAITGKIPFAGSFAEFVTGRVYDQIRQEVAYGQTNVKMLLMRESPSERTERLIRPWRTSLSCGHCRAWW